MACSNCFNGCTEIISDQCVKYTGVDVPVLGIQNGDSLSYVEQALVTFLTSTLDGTGIKIDIPTTTTICNLVQQYLPTCGDLTAVDLFNALIKATCDLQAQVDALGLVIGNIEADYNVDCLSGVSNNSGTHAILQATIDNLCALNTSFTAFSAEVEATYVKNDELCDLVTACISSSVSTKYYTKMIPYTVVEYYGDLSGNFDVTGAGLGDWEKIYLCNGLNGTPDKRGRVGIGVTDGTMGGGTMDSDVNPLSSPFNPTYAKETKAGVNLITLTSLQIPSHTHTATSVVTDPGHSHFAFSVSELTSGAATISTSITAAKSLAGAGDSSYIMVGDVNPATISPTSIDTTGITVNTTNANTGGDGAHANNQPALGCYYIMYIP